MKVAFTGNTADAGSEPFSKERRTRLKNNVLLIMSKGRQLPSHHQQQFVLLTYIMRLLVISN
jgi:hypothetical protein